MQCRKQLQTGKELRTGTQPGKAWAKSDAEGKSARCMCSGYWESGRSRFSNHKNFQRAWNKNLGFHLFCSLHADIHLRHIVVPSRIAPSRTAWKAIRSQPAKHAAQNCINSFHRKKVCFSLQIWVTAFLVSEHRSGA